MERAERNFLHDIGGVESETKTKEGAGGSNTILQNQRIIQ